MLNFPICKNCIHCCDDDEPICDNDASRTPDFVRGGGYYKTCFEMRNNIHECGRSGVFFKENEDLMDLVE